MSEKYLHSCFFFLSFLLLFFNLLQKLLKGFIKNCYDQIVSILFLTQFEDIWNMQQAKSISIQFVVWILTHKGWLERKNKINCDKHIFTAWISGTSLRGKKASPTVLLSAFLSSSLSYLHSLREYRKTMIRQCRKICFLCVNKKNVYKKNCLILSIIAISNKCPIIDLVGQDFM